MLLRSVTATDTHDLTHEKAILPAICMSSQPGGMAGK